ncbi:MAG: hypothetical protein H7833_18420 [Magnetococcus sp. DMHC-1]|nr:hypothetical protein [Magnetococcales bacterium]
MKPNLSVWRVSLLPLALFGLCLFLSYWAGSWGLAEFYVLPLEKLLVRIQDPKLSLEEKEKVWKQAVVYGKHALELHPGNAEYWLHFGQLQYIWSRQIKEDTVRASALLQEAVVSYETAARLRPTWGYTWINLAQVRMVQGRDHWPESVLHLERAMVFAPWEPSVQLNVVRLGFTLWSSLEERLQNDILNVALRVMGHSPHQVLELVKRHGKKDNILPLVRFQPTLRAEFDKYFGIVSSGEKEIVKERP